MASAKPTSLIINSAFTEPQQHWAENTDRTPRDEVDAQGSGVQPAAAQA